MSEQAKELTTFKIKKRLMMIRIIFKALDAINNTFTHKVSKRRAVVAQARQSILDLQREVKRDL
jgi:hypothetical protein